MVADQLRAYLEDGNITNSVNFPDLHMPRDGNQRLALVHANVPNMLGQISTCVAQANLNIVDMLNKSREDLAYTVLDVDSPVNEDIRGLLGGIEGVLGVRVL